MGDEQVDPLPHPEASPVSAPGGAGKPCPSGPPEQGHAQLRCQKPPLSLISEIRVWLQLSFRIPGQVSAEDVACCHPDV